MHNEVDKYEKRHQAEYIVECGNERVKTVFDPLNSKVADQLILEQIIKQLKGTRKKLKNQEEELTRCLTYLNRYKI